VYRYRSEYTLSEKLPIQRGVAASQLSYFNNNLVPYRPMVGKMSIRAPLNAVAKVLRAIGCRALVSLKTGIWSSADGIGGSAGRAGVLVIEVSGTSFDLAHSAIRVGLCRSRARRSRLRAGPWPSVGYVL
jgi:hypothetical protein